MEIMFLMELIIYLCITSSISLIPVSYLEQTSIPARTCATRTRAQANIPARTCATRPRQFGHVRGQKTEQASFRWDNEFSNIKIETVKSEKKSTESRKGLNNNKLKVRHQESNKTMLPLPSSSGSIVCFQ